MPRRLWAADVALAFCGALVLFATTATTFEARVTDLSALRVANGEVPYRDFWTMYAPGSFTLLGAVFALFGRELLISNLLGIATSAAAVAVYYALARSVCGTATAAVLAALVAVAFFGTGYSDGFTSYPPAFLLIVTAAGLGASRCGDPRPAWTAALGVVLGIAVLFKHDVAGYGVIAASSALAVIGAREPLARRWMRVATFGATVAAICAAAAIVLVGLGAGRDAWNALVRFPLGDFRFVRGEYFPIVPHWRESLVATARDFFHWSRCNLPLIALLVGAFVLWQRRRNLDTATIFVGAFAFVAFWLHWAAAHVQINTNAISLTAWAGLMAGAGLRVTSAGSGSRLRIPIAAVFALWSAASFAAEPIGLAIRNGGSGSAWLALPHLRGIRASPSDAGWMRELAAAIGGAADARAPLLFLSERNDIDLFAQSTPFWLTSRRAATRHHELHPGVTDTERVQVEMLAQVEAAPRPVVVREHRFSDRDLDTVKAALITRVPIGSTLVDQWVRRHYEEGPMFGMYEVMLARPGPEKP